MLFIIMVFLIMGLAPNHHPSIVPLIVEFTHVVTPAVHKVRLHRRPYASVVVALGRADFQDAFLWVPWSSEQC
jgi:hypothetical protein